MGTLADRACRKAKAQVLPGDMGSPLRESYAHLRRVGAVL